MQFTPIQEFPLDLVPGVEPDGRRQGEREINIETRLLFAGANRLHF